MRISLIALLVASALYGHVQPRTDRVSVAVFDRAGVSFSRMASVTRIADRVLVGSGYAIRWTDSATEPETLVVLIVTDAQFGRPLTADALGTAIVTPGEPARLAYVFVAPTRVAAKQSALDEDTAIGTVLAHEVIHLIRHSNAHDRDGLMKARWSDDDFAAAARGGLLVKK